MRRVLYILGHLDNQDIEWMVTAGTQQQCRPRICADPGGCSARCVVYRPRWPLIGDGIGVNGKEIARLGAGDVVGEMSFVDARPPSATVTVMVDAIVLGIEQSTVNHQTGTR